MLLTLYQLLLGPINHTDSQLCKSGSHTGTHPQPQNPVYTFAILPISSKGLPLLMFAIEKLCMEDYIRLQEIIVPAVVGGILALLLIIIFVSYLIAYVRRKRREGRYEAISDD